MKRILTPHVVATVKEVHQALGIKDMPVPSLLFQVLLQLLE